MAGMTIGGLGPDGLENDGDLESMRSQIDERLTEAERVAALAWPSGGAPDAVTEALHRLAQSREELAFAIEGGDTERLVRVAGTATEDAATVHEAADLVSS